MPIVFKVAGTFMRYFARSKFSKSLIDSSQEKFWLDITSNIQVRIYFVKGGRIPLLNLNELGKMLRTTIIPGNFANKIGSLAYRFWKMFSKI